MSSPYEQETSPVATLALELTWFYVFYVSAQLIRTYLFCWFNKDVPYRISQRTVGWSQQEDGSIAVEQVTHRTVYLSWCGGSFIVDS